MAAPTSYYDPAKYREGALVKVVPRSNLEAFQTSWKLHHPLQSEQLAYAGRTAKVLKSLMHHGGDVLYQLEGVPGIWHEQCLEAV
jgi:hypothetical protein